MKEISHMLIKMLSSYFHLLNMNDLIIRIINFIGGEKLHNSSTYEDYRLENFRSSDNPQVITFDSYLLFSGILVESHKFSHFCEFDRFGQVFGLGTHNPI